MADVFTGPARLGAEVSTGAQNPFNLFLKDFEEAKKRRDEEDSALKKFLQEAESERETTRITEEQKQAGRIELQREKAATALPKPFKPITREEQLQFEREKAQVQTEAQIERAERKPAAKIESQKRSIQSARTIIGTLKDKLDKIPAVSGPQARIRGGIAGILGAAGLRPDVSTFNNLRKSILGQMAKIVSGESGRLTDQDIARIEAAIPRITDTKEEREIAFQDLDRILGESERIFGEPSRPSKSFKSVQEAEKANLPTGTEITINGRRAVIE